MKAKFHRFFIALALLALATLNSQLSTAFAQGSLTPPGAPAPTMKSLDQIEARTAITNTTGVVTISQPGSYYLTHNIAVTSGDAIDITTNGVTLDLNGFTLSSTAAIANGDGIFLANLAGNSDITIFNGHIKGGVTNDAVAGTYDGPGFVNGISKGTFPSNVRVTGVSVSGCLFHGINVGYGNSTVVESCTVQNVGWNGIVASVVSHSTANQCGILAIGTDNASDCYGYATGNSVIGGGGNGMYVSFAANNCFGDGNSGDGLDATTANNCYGTSGSGTGLDASSAANNCYGTSTSGTGLNTTNANNCYGTSVSGYGLLADIATGCHGTSSSYTGLNATTALNCSGTSGGSGIGLLATTANNCYGTTAKYIGLEATTAQNCFGYCVSGGIGLHAIGSATGCYGQSPTGTGIKATIANSCIIGGGTTNITYKYNMP